MLCMNYTSLKKPKWPWRIRGNPQAQAAPKNHVRESPTMTSSPSQADSRHPAHARSLSLPRFTKVEVQVLMKQCHVTVTLLWIEHSRKENREAIANRSCWNCYVCTFPNLCILFPQHHSNITLTRKFKLSPQISQKKCRNKKYANDINTQ
jgi:hypothetical protein